MASQFLSKTISKLLRHRISAPVQASLARVSHPKNIKNVTNPTFTPYFSGPISSQTSLNWRNGGHFRSFFPYDQSLESPLLPFSQRYRFTRDVPKEIYKMRLGLKLPVSLISSTEQRQHFHRPFSTFSLQNSTRQIQANTISSIYVSSAALVGVALAIALTSVDGRNQVLAEQETTNPSNPLSPPYVDADQSTNSNEAKDSKDIEEKVVAEIRSKFWPVLWKEWKMLFAAIALAFAASVAEIITMKLGGTVIDSAMSKNIEPFMRAAWKLCGAVALQGFLQFLSYSALTQATERVRTRLSEMAFASIIYQDKSFFDAHNSAELMNRLSSDIVEIRNVLKNTISLGVRSTTSIVGGMAAAFSKSPTLALLIASAIGTAVAIGSLYARFLRRLSRASKEAASRAIIIANEATASVSTVQAFVGEEREIARHSRHVRQSAWMAQKFGIAMGFFKGISTAGVSGILVGVLLFGGKMVSAGQLTVGDLSSFVVVSSSIQSSLGNIAQLVGQISSGRDAVDRVFKIIDNKPTINPKTSEIEFPKWQKMISSQSVNNAPAVSTSSQQSFASIEELEGTVSLNDISFCYASRPNLNVLENINITLEAGKSLSLVGQSGSGKSTISKLILRFYDPNSGSVTIDGVDIKTLDPHWLRSQVGLVEQEPVLFYGTILENIGYGKPGASREEIEAAAKSANCDSFIQEFPDGYDTVVGERGAQLSGGQKQRIAIARALLKNPKILILDEATSALDLNAEKLVQDALNKLMKNRTTLIIAHRLSTIKNSDSIVVLDHGKVVEVGNHEQLLAANGFYAELIKKQSEEKGSSRKNFI